MHVVSFVAREPEKAVRPVRLERDVDALLQVSSEIVLGHLAEDVQIPLVPVEPNPAPIPRLRRRRSRRGGGGGWSRRRRPPVNQDIYRTFYPQHEVEQIHLIR